MDSRLIAGAYSQHFRALEKEVTLDDSNRIDALTRAKRLSQETNKRRKFQAHKRKLEAKREEKRRQEILSRRREEQKEATEKYQRSHLPTSARQGSGRHSPRRPGGKALEEALRLIRSGPQHERPRSARDNILSPKNENENPLERPYFDIPGHYHTRPGSGRSAHQLDPNARAELMDYSLQNLTSSKTLFEQQLEQQQNLLLEQQQKSLREFDDAVRQVTAGEVSSGSHVYEYGKEKEGMTGSESCSSLDSLEDSGKSETEMQRPNNPGCEAVGPRQRPVSAHHGPEPGQTYSQNSQQMQQEQLRLLQAHQHQQQSQQQHQHQQQQSQQHHHHQQQQQQLQQQPQKQQPFYLNASDSNNSQSSPLNQDMTASAVYQRDSSLYGMPRKEAGSHVASTSSQQHNHPYVGLTREDILKNHNRGVSANIKSTSAQQQGEGEQKFQLPVKQFSTDSLESCSSNSSISVVKIPLASKTDHSSPALGVGNTSIGGNLNNCQMTRTDGHPAGNSTVGASASQGQLAWVAPSPQSNNTTPTPTQTPTPTNKHEPVMDDFHPRYASAIGLSIWPGQNAQNHIPSSVMSTLIANNYHPYSSRGTLTSVTTTTSFPASIPGRSVPVTNIAYSTAGAKTDTVLQSGVVGSSLSSSHAMNSEFSSLNKHDLTYPYVQNYSTGASVANKHTSPTSQAYNHQQHVTIPSSQVMQSEVATSNRQVSIQIPGTQSHVPVYPQQYGQEIGASSVTQENKQQQQQQQQMYQNHQMQTGPVPVPAVRTIFPTNRPPAPAITTTTATKLTPGNAAAQTKLTGVTNGLISTVGAVKDYDGSSMKNVDEDAVEEEDSDDVRPLKGILKQAPSKGVPQTQGKTSQGKGHPRDSLELARAHHDRKGKKKSVRFADNDIEEDDNEIDDTDQFDTRAMMITNSGTQFYKNSMNRPVSAKVVSVSAKSDNSLRGPRAASAGTVRQTPTVSEHMQIRNVQQLQSTNAMAESSNAANNFGQNQRSNLPPSFANPLHTTPIHRPKAAAHIIMSTDLQQLNKGMINGHDHHGQMGALAATAHKSNFDSKVKSVNKNFMSKVPVKIPAGANTSAMVYHVAQAGRGGDLSSTANTNGNMTAEEEQQQALKEAQHQQNVDKTRMNYSASKKVPISNATVTRTSIVPASTKITYPQSNSGAPSYSSNTAGTGTNAVYDENGMRIDRTPTDEEITWLWDKVRNCLNKDEGGNKSQPAGVGGGVNNDQGSRQPQTMSTKLIDGAALGFGTNNTTGMNGLRTGTGFGYPRAQSATNTQNKVKPALQQQGSYLRRYGLLKQRRVNSASAVGSGAVTAGQRVSSAVYGRQPAVQPSQPATSGQPQEPPPTMAFGYKPQDEVSESTAAFMMAERLAKQSLSDSHIQAAMEDAKNKQEAHNRARLAVSRANSGGPTALSVEEQRLLESLDKLNDRLRVTDPKYTGTIHYHQPFQPHFDEETDDSEEDNCMNKDTVVALPGFRGHTPVIDTRRHNMLMSPRTQQRAQSARIRQQTRQYR